MFMSVHRRVRKSPEGRVKRRTYLAAYSDGRARDRHGAGRERGLELEHALVRTDGLDAAQLGDEERAVGRGGEGLRLRCRREDVLAADCVYVRTGAFNSSQNVQQKGKKLEMRAHAHEARPVRRDLADPIVDARREDRPAPV